MFIRFPIIIMSFSIIDLHLFTPSNMHRKFQSNSSPTTNLDSHDIIITLQQSSLQIRLLQFLSSNNQTNNVFPSFVAITNPCKMLTVQQSNKTMARNKHPDYITFRHSAVQTLLHASIARVPPVPLALHNVVIL